MRHATNARTQRGDREQAQTRKKQALDVTRNESYLPFPPYHPDPRLPSFFRIKSVTPGSSFLCRRYSRGLGLFQKRTLVIIHCRDVHRMCWHLFFDLLAEPQEGRGASSQRFVLCLLLAYLFPPSTIQMVVFPSSPRHTIYIFQPAATNLVQRRIILLGMLAPHLTGNVLVGGDRSSLLVGTDGKDGRADAEDADVGDGRVALPGGGGGPPAAVWRPDLFCGEIVVKGEVG